MSYHKDEVGSSLHVVNALTYADAATRLAGAGLIAADIGKIAKQTDTDRYYILLNNSPVQWSEVTAPSNGGGGVNYISNTNSEDSVSPWVAYADAAGPIPVDGTGGVPNITITRSTTLPLRGAASFLITKDAANRQGQGVSIDFTIDRADLAQPLSIEFDYEPGVGFVSGDLSDFRVYIYDVTNAQVIQPAPYTIQGGVNGKWTFKSIFQASANSQSYRLILHIATVSAIAWTFKCDNFRVGPQAVLLGAPVGDFVAYTPTVAGLGTGSATATGFYRRVGDGIELQIAIVKDGNAGTGAATVTATLPTGLVANTAKIASASSRAIIGPAAYVTAAFSSLVTSTFVDTSTGLINLGNNTTGNVFQGADFGANRTLYLRGFVPIVGFGSSVVMSNDADTRVVAAKVTTSVSSGATNTVNFSVTSYDTHGAVSSPGSQTRFTAPISGYYNFSAQLVTNAVTDSINNAFRGYITINDSVTEFAIGRHTVQTASSAKQGFSGTTTAFMNAGDYAELSWSAGAVVTLDGTALNYWSIERVSGPSAIAASEIVAARYTTTTTQNFSGAETRVNFDTKTIDTHNAVTVGVGTWVFRVPVSGLYRITGQIALNNVSAGQLSRIFVNNGGTSFSQSVLQPNSNDVTKYSGQVQDVLPCTAGQDISIRLLSTDGSTDLDTNVGQNIVTIEKIGGIA